MRKAVAQCYFHSPMPSLMRRFRDRYQLTKSPNGKLPRFERRKEPGARILYFHRVNDENDPFFPSMPTALFEQEMQFGARHYRVGGLSELQRHLASGLREMVLGLTCDGGDRGNDENACPVLRRHGCRAR